VDGGGVCPVAFVVELALPVRPVGGKTDVGKTAASALDQPAEEVSVPGVPLAEEKMSLEVLLRLPPYLLGHEGGDGPGDDRPTASGPFAKLVGSHVRLVGDQPSNAARAPHSGSPRLPLAT